MRNLTNTRPRPQSLGLFESSPSAGGLKIVQCLMLFTGSPGNTIHCVSVLVFLYAFLPAISQKH